MKSEAELIIKTLLDKYEKSVLSRQGSSLQLTIKVKVLSLFPKYDNSDYYAKRKKIDDAIEYLEEQGLIWIEANDDGIGIIGLQLDEIYIRKGYQLLNRTYLPDYKERVVELLTTYMIEEDWLIYFRDEMIRRLNNYQSISRYLLIEDITEIEDIFKVLLVINYQETEISFRKFSLQQLGDSKRLESIKGKIINIINDFYYDTFNDEDELFASFNVIKNPGFIYLRGAMVIQVNEQIIDLEKLASPFSLTTANIKNLVIKEIKASNVVTIENLTSFYDCELADTITIYLGGYHNQLRRELLLKIYDFSKRLNFYHFGDIDAGGFYIYLHLINKTKIPFQRLAMNRETIIEYCQYTKKLTPNDKKRLLNLKLLINDEVIDYMLENNQKLEQEIVTLPVDYLKFNNNESN